MTGAGGTWSHASAAQGWRTRDSSRNQEAHRGRTGSTTVLQETNQRQQGVMKPSCSHSPVFINDSVFIHLYLLREKKNFELTLETPSIKVKKKRKTQVFPCHGVKACVRMLRKCALSLHRNSFPPHGTAPSLACPRPQQSEWRRWSRTSSARLVTRK